MGEAHFSCQFPHCLLMVWEPGIRDGTEWRGVCKRKECNGERREGGNEEGIQGREGREGMRKGYREEKVWRE